MILELHGPLQMLDFPLLEVNMEYLQFLRQLPPVQDGSVPKMLTTLAKAMATMRTKNPNPNFLPMDSLSTPTPTSR